MITATCPFCNNTVIYLGVSWQYDELFLWECTVCSAKYIDKWYTVDFLTEKKDYFIKEIQHD